MGRNNYKKNEYMEYHGKLYGKAGNSYFPLEATTSDFEALQKRVIELEAEKTKHPPKTGDIEILLRALEHIGRWGDKEEEDWDDPGDCVMDALTKYRYSLNNQ